MALGKWPGSSMPPLDPIIYPGIVSSKQMAVLRFRQERRGNYRSPCFDLKGWRYPKRVRYGMIVIKGRCRISDSIINPVSGLG
jgi:hypothetical protein